MAGEAALAGPARDAVQHGDTGAVLELAHDLVAEHRARRSMPELLDVGSTQAARANAYERAGSGRLRKVGELGEPVVVENDRAHRRIVGGTRGPNSAG